MKQYTLKITHSDNPDSDIEETGTIEDLAGKLPAHLREYIDTQSISNDHFALHVSSNGIKYDIYEQTEPLQPIRTKIADKLKEHRTLIGMTQSELAEKAGLGFATIQRIEQAKFWPGLKQYIILRKALGIPDHEGLY